MAETPRVRQLNLCRQYFDLVATGTKTQLDNIRAIYPSEKEALGALAIEITLLPSELGDQGDYDHPPWTGSSAPRS
jgi:hypothetical protein